MATLFKYSTGGRDVMFTDKEDAYTPEDIRKHWAQTFPELSNATAETDAKKQTVTNEEGQEVEVDKVVSFVKKVGTKGSGPVLNLYRVQGKLGIEDVVFAHCDLWVEAWDEPDAINTAKEALDQDPTYKIGWTAGPSVQLLGAASSSQALVERLKALVGDEALVEVNAGGQTYDQIGPLLFKRQAVAEAA